MQELPLPDLLPKKIRISLFRPDCVDGGKARGFAPGHTGKDFLPLSEPKRKKVLVVEDTDSVQVMLRRWIINEGYDIELASNGPQALDIAAHSPPDLILLDVMMPGLNGYAVCRQLRESQGTKTTPIIVITALPAAMDSEEGKRSGANEVVVKPLNREDVMRRIKSYLGSVFARP